MEEARLDFFKKIGFDYLDFEKMGVMSPVIGLNNIRYKRPSTVGDTIEIETSVKAYNSIVLTMHYVMRVKDTVIFEGDSDHCFLSKEGKMLPLGDKKFPELDRKLKELLNQEK
jgi:acyl-CoA thioester hydrolase